MASLRKFMSALLIAVIFMSGSPMMAAAATKPQPAPTPTAINIVVNPSGPLAFYTNTTQTVALTSDYKNKLVWTVSTSLGTASLSPTSTSPGTHITTLTLKSSSTGTGTVTITATDGTNRRVKSTKSIGITVSAPQNTNQPRYVALGDSIPDGYYNTSLWNYLGGGTDSYSYIEQLRDRLSILPENYFDKSVSGYKTMDVLQQLSDPTIKNNIAQADVITICIGGNEIMDAAPRTMSGLDKNNVNWSIADAGRNNFESNWYRIIDGIETINSDVTLMVMTIYNPYRSTDTNYAKANSYFENTTTGKLGLNTIIRNTETLYDTLLSDTFDYRVVDIYQSFNAYPNKDSLTGFYNSFCDPHPNQTGHNLIAAEHDRVYHLSK
mgnify:CR=1 FL=1